MKTQPFSEFAGNKRLLWIAEEWERYSPELAKWAMKRIVNRRDVWSQYTLKANGEVGVVMLPIKERREKGAVMVTMNKLQRHFAGHAVNHLIGLHSISDHSTCKWFAIDIDLHDESILNADEMAENNFAVALLWANQLREQGMDPMIIDSNGVGGYHLWVLLDRQYPLARTFDFADTLRSNWEELGLPRRPEIFPPKREVKEDDLPYTLRLPGRHHRRPHYSRVWNFDPIGENEWLEGGDAIETMMALTPSKLPKLKASDVKESKTKAQSEKTKKPEQEKKTPGASTGRKPKVCVDLDGVLATYDKWEGIETIGDPIEGAREFAEELSKFADIIIFTTRCSAEPDYRGNGSPETAGQARIHIIDWLEKHNIPFADVYIGQGKPRAAAFIDDRAVVCKPQKDDDAYTETLSSVRDLLKRKK